MKNFRIALLPLVLAFSTQTVQAAYEVRAALSIPNPPSVGSQEEATDYKVLHDIQNTRTAEDCRIAQAQTSFNLNSLFGGPDGVLSREQVQTLSGFMKEVEETADDAAKVFKEKFGRLRPYDRDPTIRPCITKPNRPGVARSYPSGHATIGMLMGLVLADLMPNDAATFERHGMHVGMNRVIGGVHHPSDVEAGQILARELYQVLQKNPAYRADFMQAKRRLP